MSQTIVEMIGDDAVNCSQVGEAETYETNGFEGVIVLLNNCHGQPATLIYVAARVPGESRFIVLGIQAVDEAMIDAVPTILNSFRWNDDRSARGRRLQVRRRPQPPGTAPMM